MVVQPRGGGARSGAHARLLHESHHTPCIAGSRTSAADSCLVCLQFMGKDNIPFHTIIFPATLLGTGKKWTMMKRISVTEYLNYEGGKFSKSRGVGVFGNDAKDTGIPVEVLYSLLYSIRCSAHRMISCCFQG